jgi:DNA-binding NarL/FixJ family response regulator
MIRVAVVENETLVRQGLLRVLELDLEIEVCGEAADGEAALVLIEAQKPDVVLLDVRMPKLDGIGVLRALQKVSRFPPCLILTTFNDTDVALDAVRAGAKGYLLKDVSFEELGEAIRTLARGGTYIAPVLTNALREEASAPKKMDPDRVDRLTDRELEVLRLMAGGYSNKEIGEALSVAERTIKNHVSSILQKLYVRDRTRAVLKALELRLL